MRLVKTGLPLVLAGVAALLGACSESGEDIDPDPACEQETENGAPADAAIEAKLREKCATCHGFPEPDVMPRHAWGTSIDKMFELANLRLPSKPEEKLLGFTPAEAKAWFEARAPESLETPPFVVAPEGPKVLPTRRHFRANQSSGRPAGVANVRLAHLDGADGPLHLIVCDMLGERVLVGDARAPEKGLDVIAELPAPARTEPVDLDGDGRLDLVVSALGDPGPTDERLGAVIWLRRTEDGGWERHDLATRLGRVAETRAADVDGDGDVDLLSAVFGWYTTGELMLLRNETEDGGEPTFERIQLDSRSGAMNVSLHDLDDDGRLDFVTTLSQEHEKVLAFLGKGGRAFEEHVLYDAGQPHHGHTGHDPVDFDGDGDIDFLVTNGDTLDDEIKMKPYHGIAWLENHGDLRFERHVIGLYAGAHRAMAVDLDGDGDLDVVAASFLPGVGADAPPDLVWFERRADGSFAPHALLDDGGRHATVVSADLDGDGLADLVVGNISVQPPFPEDPERLVEVLLSGSE